MILSLPSLTEKDLSPYFDRADLIRQAAGQLKKDLDPFGLEIELPEDMLTTYEKLFSQTEPFIKKLIDHHFEKLLQLLYRIDVQEKLVKEAVEKSGQVSHAITRLILYRELQKVVIRNTYSA
jgi:hypothetical protein